LARIDPARALGVRAATGGLGAWTVLGGGVVAVAAVVASLLFAANVSALDDDPARYGWPYDVAVTLGFGYGGGDDEAIAAGLDRPEVSRWGTAALGTATIDGQIVPVVAARSGFESFAPPLLSGRHPVADDEIALGAETLDRIGLGVGDEVEVTGYYGARRLVVTGVVVLPAVGPYESDRASSGSGAYLPAAAFGAMVATAEADTGVPPGSLAEGGLTSLVAVDLVDGVDSAAFVADLGDRTAWDRNGYESIAVARPIAPPAVVEIEALRRLPLLLAAAVGVAMVVGLTLTVAVAARSRGPELRTLRALGFSRAQLRRTVRWQGTTAGLVGAVVGVPLGVVVGRAAARLLARELSVVEVVVVPWAVVLGSAVAAVAVSVLAALGPARSASHPDGRGSDPA